ncbi:Uncharacterised protein [Legionella jordanis]|nr:Uncharacterised protein [Legionella jordanis]
MIIPILVFAVLAFVTLFTKHDEEKNNEENFESAQDKTE